MMIVDSDSVVTFQHSLMSGTVKSATQTFMLYFDTCMWPAQAVARPPDEIASALKRPRQGRGALQGWGACRRFPAAGAVSSLRVVSFVIQ